MLFRSGIEGIIEIKDPNIHTGKTAGYLGLDYFSYGIGIIVQMRTALLSVKNLFSDQRPCAMIGEQF